MCDDGSSSSYRTDAATLCAHQLLKVPFDAAASSRPRRSLGDISATGLRTEQLKNIFGHAVIGPVGNRPINDSIPRFASIELGRPLADGIDDPSGWLVRQGGKSISMSGVGFAVQTDVLDE